MAIFRYAATLGPGETHFWSVGGNYFQSDHVPQLDVRLRPSPGLFTGDESPALFYGDFASSISASVPYNATYYVKVENRSDRTVPYDMRVWLP